MFFFTILRQVRDIKYHYRIFVNSEHLKSECKISAVSHCASGMADYREIKIPADPGDTGFSIVKLRQRVSQAFYHALCFIYAWSESQFWGMYRKYGVICQHQHCQNLLYLPVFTTFEPLA